MSKQQRVPRRALAATIAYAVGIGYVLHLVRTKPQATINILAVVGAVTVAYMLASGAVAVAQMIKKWSNNV